LLAVIVATFVTTSILEPEGWPIGFLVTPARAARERLSGIGFAILLVGTCDLLLVIFAGGHHTRRDGVPWLELATVFVPAAFHEEVAFRGYLFQKLRSWHRAAGYAFSAFVFALLHLGNHAITPLALGNIAAAGILLALAYERYERLWFPIGIHLAWNILSGPILGYPVSGYIAHTTVFSTTARGADWITGGSFGIEGSVFIAVVEITAIAWLGYHPRRIPRKESTP
jgi:membrane protease YdiL (CAAX protease family)